MAEVQIATESFSETIAGIDYEVEAGVTRHYEDNPIVLRHPDRFEPADKQKAEVKDESRLADRPDPSTRGSGTDSKRIFGGPSRGH